MSADSDWGADGETGRYLMSRREWIERQKRKQHELETLLEAFELPLPWGPYRAAVVTCYRCAERIPVYTWVGHRVRETDWPPAPRPGILHECTSAESGGMRYWANHCPVCDGVQGDHYLYDDEYAPFKHTWKTPLPSIPGGPLPPQLYPADFEDEAQTAEGSSLFEFLNGLLRRR